MDEYYNYLRIAYKYSINNKTKYHKGGGYNKDNIVNENNELFVSRIPDTNYYLAAERLTYKNINQWKNYSRHQSNTRNTLYASQFIPSYTADGSNHFELVLKSFSDQSTNMIFICYVTTQYPRLLNDDDMNYGFISTGARPSEYLSNIVMYVTVTSDPSALVASHMGVSLSIEGAMGKHRGLSIQLHSFGAKVILSLNPQVKYQINAPNGAMLNLLIEAMPKNIYVGTREMLKLLEERSNLTIRQIKDKLKESILTQRIAGLTEQLDKIKKQADLDEYDLEKKSELEKKIYELETQGTSHSFVVEKLKKAVDEYLDPYDYTDRKGNKIDSLDVLSKYKPIISKPEDKTGDFMTIYKPNTDEVDFVIPQKQSSYRWMNTEAFWPAGNTNYCALDYKLLADSKEIANPKDN